MSVKETPQTLPTAAPKAPAGDKRKVIVLGALGLFLVGVGAFQFMPGDAPAPPATTAKKLEAKKAEEAEKPMNPEVAFDLPMRDPFKGPDLPDPSKANNTAPKKDEAIKPPKSIKGELPVDPTKGAGPGTGVPTPDAPFTYIVVGVVVGDTPVAIFQDSQGRQRMIRQGASLDPDTQVISISTTEVSVHYRGKTLHLKTGGNTVAK